MTFVTIKQHHVFTGHFTPFILCEIVFEMRGNSSQSILIVNHLFSMNFLIHFFNQPINSNPSSNLSSSYFLFTIKLTMKFTWNKICSKTLLQNVTLHSRQNSIKHFKWSLINENTTQFSCNGVIRKTMNQREECACVECYNNAAEAERQNWTYCPDAPRTSEDYLILNVSFHLNNHSNYIWFNMYATFIVSNGRCGYRVGL